MADRTRTAARRLLLVAAVLAVTPLALSQLSCAVGSLTPLSESMPAARASLKPEYRFFYDALVDYGAWVLIEPYGYVFRPSVAFETWRPFGDGFWVPTDLYGWVWVSAEPFGWATYHYGQWLYDPYQHWVWIPGLDWAPARVAWETAGSYVGWAPLMPAGTSYSSIPGGAYRYVAASDLTSTDVASRLLRAGDLGAGAEAAQSVRNPGEVEGVEFNRGPSMEWVQRVAGPLRLSKIQDLVPPRALPARGTVTAQPAPAAPSDSLAEVRRAAVQAARQARALVKSGGAPPEKLPVVRPFGVSAPDSEAPLGAPLPPAARSPIRKPAARPDSTR